MASTFETTLIKLMESQAHTLQQVLETLKSMNNVIQEQNQNSPRIIPNNQIKPFNCNNSSQTEATEGAEVDNPASVGEQQGEVNQATDYVYEEHKPLYEAAKEGNWNQAEEIFKADPGAKTKDITIESETALNIAADHTKWAFVEKLVGLVPPKALEQKDSKYGYTALHTAAMEGNTEIVKLMVKTNPLLTQMRDNSGRVPLHTAAKFVSEGQEEVLKYLYSVTRHDDPSPFTGQRGASLLCDLIDSNFYDIALSIVQSNPKLVTEKTKNRGVCALEVLVRRPFSFQSGNKTTWWQRHLYLFLQKVDTEAPNYLDNRADLESPRESSTMCRRAITKFIMQYLNPYLTRVSFIKKVYDQKFINEQASKLVSTMLEQIGATMNKSNVIDFFKQSSLMKTAITYGTTEVIVQCLQKFPYLLWSEMEGQTMVQIAIAERNDKIFNFICKKSEEDMDELNSRTDDKGNTILHYAADIAPSHQLNSVSGAAFQMQREAQWFKGVKSILLERYRLVRNKDGMTAQCIFTDKHKDLVIKGEKWMRGTSHSCMIAATLISTVAFAAAFTVPGGNYNDANRNTVNGLPILLNSNSFIVFAVADALALFSSITSVLMFLAILTSRYSEEDFVKALPRKFILGLATLFISMATMMIAFGSAIDIILCPRWKWIIIPITSLGSVPVALFLWLLFPLFAEMVRSTYWPTIFDKRTLQRNIKGKKLV
ncbi:protein ACCELERATED CELL DEATH 6-like [Papaver somniferum]|nr:protein ACCELERATED CELL DEATH 6-like [Papaver somniferum]